MTSGTFKKVRIAVLLVILAVVAGNAWWTKKLILRWTRPLVIGIFPIVADALPETQAYVDALGPEAFASLAPFFQREATRYQVYGDPVVEVVKGPTIAGSPPDPREDSSTLAIVFWSLELRYWALTRLRAVDAPASDIKVFVRYHGHTGVAVLDDSFGLPEGHLAVVNAFATVEAEGSNAVVIAHEVLHTAGATDKYDEQGLPRAPDGYAEPDRQPLWPQVSAELMGGRIPISATEAKMPSSLDECVVGPATAKEVNWIWKEWPEPDTEPR